MNSLWELYFLFDNTGDQENEDYTNVLHWFLGMLAFSYVCYKSFEQKEKKCQHSVVIPVCWTV